jgi:hypothetical protein
MFYNILDYFGNYWMLFICYFEFIIIDWTFYVFYLSLFELFCFKIIYCTVCARYKPLYISLYFMVA